MSTVIGISGFASSGKTTAAKYIEEVYGVARIHIATTLRSMLKVMLSDIGMSDERIFSYLEGEKKEHVIPEIGITSRQLQIELGMWGRKRVNQDVWVDTWAGLVQQRKDRTIAVHNAKTGRFTSVPSRGSMNDSVRFPNEEDKIEELGGFTILIERPDTHPVAFKWNMFGFEIGRFLYERFGLMIGVHDSERIDRLSPTYTLINDGTIEDLHRQIDNVMRLEGIERLAKAA